MKKLLLSLAGLALVASAYADTKVYFEDDFEWLKPWAVESGAGNTIAADNDPSVEKPLDTKAPALTSVITEIDGVEVSCFDFVESKGYTFLYDKGDKKRIYLQDAYLKFGKTGNHGGIMLPSVSDVPEGATVFLSFDWCPMRQGSGKIDPVTLYVEVKNGEESMKFDVPVCDWENDHKLEWIKANIELKDAVINKDTKISITQNEWEVSTANRWFFDNVKLYSDDSSAVAGIEAAQDAPVEYYNLQGTRVNNPSNGIYIVKQGNKVEKRMIR